jgi:hypothetical protein
MTRRHIFALAALAVLGGGVVAAQLNFGGGGGFGGGRRGGGGGGGWGNRGGRDTNEYMQGNEPITPIPSDRAGVPEWKTDPRFKSDTFTFCRLRFSSDYNFSDGTRKSGGGWKNDWPNADLNISFRLQQMTAMKVNPEPVILNINDPRLFDYPFTFVHQVGRMSLSEEEVAILRRYLLNGGFLMADDHWGLTEQRNWREQMQRIFPDRPQVDLTIEHPIFHCVFDLKAMPQVPTMQFWLRFYNNGEPEHTWRYDDDREPHYRAIYDDRGRMMVLQCANTDTGDGLQREGDSEEYFHRYSEKLAYPLMINVIAYVMTH